MWKVVGEIFKSTCGRRLLAYYWFSILVPSSHHCMTVLWGTRAFGDTGRGLQSEQVMSQPWHHHPLQKRREETTWKRLLSPILQSESSAMVPIPHVFQIAGGTAEVREQEHDTQDAFMSCGHVSSFVSRSHRCTEGTAAHEPTFPVIKPSSCGNNPFWFAQTWVTASEHQRQDCSQCPYTGSRRGGGGNRNGFSEALNQGHYSSSLAGRKQQLLLHHVHFVFPLKAENKVGHYFIFQKPRLRILGKGTA